MAVLIVGLMMPIRHGLSSAYLNGHILHGSKRARYGLWLATLMLDVCVNTGCCLRNNPVAGLPGMPDANDGRASCAFYSSHYGAFFRPDQGRYLDRLVQASTPMSNHFCVSEPIYHTASHTNLLH